jgi:hypothetical protein
LELNGTHQLLGHADGFNSLGESVNKIRENSKTLLDASSHIGPEINAEKKKYTMSRFRIQDRTRI